MIIKSKLNNYKVDFRYKINLGFFKSNRNSIYIIDSNVYKKFDLKKLKLKKKILINPTEKKKDFFYLHRIIDILFRLKIKKKDVIISIGGGVIQDISSFVSSIIFRGITWYYLPTTIIGQCDSCIGGKTSINYKGIKNQLGNFYPPKKIIIIKEFLNRITNKNLLSGVGEMAHYFYIAGGKDLNFFLLNLKKVLEGNLIKLFFLIKKSLKIKKFFIERDEFDSGKRLILNYGHTFGHALEKYFNNNLAHGIAVAEGMDIANFLSYKYGFMSQKNYLEIKKTLKKIYRKDSNITNINRYIKILELDKKNIRGMIRVIFSKKPGQMFIYNINDKKKLKKYLVKYFNI